MSLHVVGVRHHSPACARLVQQTLARVRPRWVLIEGPSDFNGRLAELSLDHEPPVALFSFHFSDERRHSSWSPFCSHSPEWVGLRDGRALGAEVRFIDLPAWSRELEGVENRYADGPRLEGADEALQGALGERGYDAFWDAAFELPDPGGLAERLRVYFDGLRDAHPVTASDLGREAFMARYVRWALGQGGDVVLICGGFHAPVLRAAAEEGPLADEPSPPEAPADSRSATWLIPFDQGRLDSFRGYASGLPSPAWYRWVWTRGADEAPRQALRATAEGLRARRQGISVADSVAAWTQARALARLRGHRVVGRVDLLDAVASTWVKEALEAPLPWTARQQLAPGTHPVVVELVAALSGSLRGRLHPDTPLPPLVHHVRALWTRLELRPTDALQRLKLRRGAPEDAEKLYALERLVLLRVDGFARIDTDGVQVTYAVRRTERTDSTLLEAASYGPTLEAAALAVLEEAASGADGFADRVALLVAAVDAGLPGLSARALAGLVEATAEEPRLDVMGRGLARLVGLLHHGGLEADERAALGPIADAAVDRALWLMEGVHGDGPVDRGRVDAVVAVRDAALAGLYGAPARLDGVLRRLGSDPDAPADLRGAALGAAASLGTQDLHVTAALALRCLEQIPGTRLGDYLAGLLPTAREVLAEGTGLLAGVDAALCALDAHAFLVAVPSLRVAFQGLPPRERAAMGRAIARLHGGRVAPLHGVLVHDPVLVARGAALDAAATELLRRYGLLDV